MMQNLFGDQSEEEEEIDSEHESNPQPNYASVLSSIHVLISLRPYYSNFLRLMDVEGLNFG